MARSLFDKWKQVIYYKADQPLTPQIVENVISNLYDAGFTVVAITTDLGSSYNKVWTQLNIGINDSHKAASFCIQKIKVLKFLYISMSLIY